MKPSRNKMRGLGYSYSVAFIPVMLLYTFIILVFASAHGSNIYSGKDVSSPQQSNYSEIVDKTVHGRKHNLMVDQQNKKKVQFNWITASGKPHINKTLHSMLFLAIETDKEKGLEIESWILENKLFEKTDNSYKNEVEKPLEIEEWMIDSLYFRSLEPFHEEDLKIENWMTNDHLWGY